MGGEDLKVYVIGEEVFAVRGKSALAGPLPLEDRRPSPVTREIADMALAITRIFALDVCGIDFVETRRGLAVVDVNSFPSFNGVPKAAQRLADCILSRASRPFARSLSAREKQTAPRPAERPATQEV